jgi:hypothetical protein
MGARRVAWGAAVLAAAVLVGTGALVWSAGLSPKSRFAHWLAAQPQVASVDQLFPGTRPDGDVRRPTAEVTTKDPLTLARVEGFMAALEGYAAEHAEATFSTVQLHHGRDHVLAAGRHTGNAEVVAALRALRGLPDLYAVDIGIDPYPAHATAVLTTGSDLVAAADTLVRSGAVEGLRSPTWRSAGLTVRGEGLPHTVTVHSDVAPSARAAQAFAVATRLEGRSPVQLVVQPPGADGTWTELRLDEHSPTGATTRSAVNALGFGMPQHLERVPGVPYSDHDASFDTAAWRRATLPAVEAVPGVRAATLSDPNSSDRAVLDVRVGAGVDLAALAATAPDPVDLVAVHTADRAPEYVRKAVLPADPETRCPAGPGGSVNESFTGPAQVLSRVSGQLESLVGSPGVTCVHWYVPPSGSAQSVQTLRVRVPLQPEAWRPLLDRLADLWHTGSSTDLSIAVLLGQSDSSWTPVLLVLAGGDEADATTLDGATPAQVRSGAVALQPLVDHWRTAVR